ncbi:MAG: class I SAM-dependent methyltransferase, partial [Nitrospirota bacterium]
VGIDLSEAMINRAKKKASKIFKNIKANKPTFLVDEIRSMKLKKSFDIILCMFSVLGYQLNNEDVFESLRNIHRHLKNGGIFVCDLWYGPGVLTIKPSDKIKMIESKKYKLIRSAHSKLDIIKHIAEINYHLWFLKGQKLVSETVEVHKVRFFFPQEIAFFMRCAGLQLISLTSFPTLDQQPTDITWNILCVARSV